jgi:hypothetical protein
MLQAERLLPRVQALDTPLQRKRFRLTLGICYRAPWRLPGPDLHRQVNTSLHETASFPGLTSFRASRSLGTPHMG